MPGPHKRIVRSSKANTLCVHHDIKCDAMCTRCRVVGFCPQCLTPRGGANMLCRECARDARDETPSAVKRESSTSAHAPATTSQIKTQLETQLPATRARQELPKREPRCLAHCEPASAEHLISTMTCPTCDVDIVVCSEVVKCHACHDAYLVFNPDMEAGMEALAARRHASAAKKWAEEKEAAAAAVPVMGVWHPKTDGPGEDIEFDLTQPYVNDTRIDIAIPQDTTLEMLTAAAAAAADPQRASGDIPKAAPSSPPQRVECSGLTCNTTSSDLCTLCCSRWCGMCAHVGWTTGNKARLYCPICVTPLKDLSKEDPDATSASATTRQCATCHREGDDHHPLTSVQCAIGHCGMWFAVCDSCDHSKCPHCGFLGMDTRDHAIWECTDCHFVHRFNRRLAVCKTWTRSLPDEPCCSKMKALAEQSANAICQAQTAADALVASIQSRVAATASSSSSSSNSSSRHPTSSVVYADSTVVFASSDSPEY